MMFLIICDECGKEHANILQMMTNGWIEAIGNLNSNSMIAKSKTVHLCSNHWPEKGATQPKNCKRVKFVWPEDGPPDPPFAGPVPPPFTGHWELVTP